MSSRCGAFRVRTSVSAIHFSLGDRQPQKIWAPKDEYDEYDLTPGQRWHTCVTAIHPGLCTLARDNQARYASARKGKVRVRSSDGRADFGERELRRKSRDWVYWRAASMTFLSMAERTEAHAVGV